MAPFLVQADHSEAYAGTWNLRLYRVTRLGNKADYSSLTLPDKYPWNQDSGFIFCRKAL